MNLCAWPKLTTSAQLVEIDCEVEFTSLVLSILLGFHELLNCYDFIGMAETCFFGKSAHTVQKLIVIFDKLHRTFDFFISLYDMHACKKKLEKINSVNWIDKQEDFKNNTKGVF